jgi:hypothetical protein|tara:strand:- start:906 stop:1661 length:756 start_codon:yes stop_codon:yes gene_type:complete
MNLSGFDSFHCHVICPETRISELKTNNLSPNCTISYEIITDVKKVLHHLNCENYHWLNIKEKSIRAMLITEAYRNSRIKSFLFNLVNRIPLFSDILIDKLSPLRYINETKFKTYYSLRRFLMPQSFFSHVKGLLITDIDSHFQFPLDFSELDSSSSQAISRNGMWSKFMAGFVFFKFESLGKSTSLFTLDELIIKLIQNQGLHWGIDQIALDSLGKRKLLSSINSIKHSFSSDYDEDTIFVSIKGPSKWKD